MHEAHTMQAMFWSTVVLGAMPFLIVGTAVVFYLRTQRAKEDQ